MNLRVLILCLASGLAAVSQGFPPPPIAWWDNPVANGLELTEEQKARVSRIRNESNERLLQSREAVDRAERELDAIFNSSTIDRNKAKLAIDQLADARRDLTRDVSWMMLRMRAVLTFDQWKMLETRRQNSDPRGKGRGFRGGPKFNETRP